MHEGIGIGDIVVTPQAANALAFCELPQLHDLVGTQPGWNEYIDLHGGIMPETKLQLGDMEATGAALVRRFNAAWSAADSAALGALLADDVRYLVYAGGPEYRGREQVGEVVARFMARFQRIEFRVLRLACLGPVAIHERSEHYYGSDGRLDTRFQVVGVLLIRDGLIADWRDYAVPGVEQIAGPLCRSG